MSARRRPVFSKLVPLRAAILAALLPVSAGAALLNPGDYASLGALQPLSGSVTFDTDALTVQYQSFGFPAPVTNTLHGVVQSQAGGPDVAVFAFDNVLIGAGIGVNVVGSRPFALLSTGSVLIGSSLDLSGRELLAGPGGGNGGTEAAPNGVGPGGGAESLGSPFGPGFGTGGGGGFGGAGGAGASSDFVILGAPGAGGVSYGDLRMSLQGGSGGAGTVPQEIPSRAGGGGGAIEIVAAGLVSLAGIAAHGATGTGMAGAGSGGGIVIAGQLIVNSGSFDAAGGDQIPSTIFAGTDLLRGGGGGGGRVLIAPSIYLWGTQTGANGANVAGGVSAHSGQSGVLVFAPGLTAIGSGQLVDLTTLDTAHVFPGEPEFQFALGGVVIEAGGIGYANGLYGAHGDVVLAGGLLATPDGLDMAGHALRGNGSLVGRLHLDALASLRAEGGLLAVGDGNRSGMLELAGTIGVGAHSTLVLNEAEAAHLGAHTTLEDASRLVSVNGLVLDAGNVLDATGAAEIQGTFTNQGSVRAPIPDGGQITFLGDVNGAGNFEGAIVFHAGYSPGNSPATIDFGGGVAQYDASSVLTMEIAGPPESGAYDRLTNIGTLDFHGLLKILFTGGYVPQPGATFDLFDFANFTGGFDRIAVEGFDATKLDFSRLAIDGSLRAVPLPAALWPFAIGCIALARRRR